MSKEQTDYTHPTTDFYAVAKSILKNSIKSAICIDDQFEQPYMSEQEIEDRNSELSTRDHAEVTLDKFIPKGLYRSFRADGKCDLDIYNFKSIADSWVPEFMLNNKDLLIIDWELEGKDGFKSTIEIIKQAIMTNNYTTVPFIIIYTAKPSEDFRSIVEEILNEFNPYSVDGQKEVEKFLINFLKAFLDCFNDVIPGIDEMEDFINKNTKLLYEYWLYIDSDVKETIFQDLCKSINSHFDIKEIKRAKTHTKFKVSLETTFKTLDRGINNLYYTSIKTLSTQNFSVERIKSRDIGIKIESTVLTIFSKAIGGTTAGLEPEDVFNAFSELISRDPHNFLTLLSIEMRDKLREDSYKIGENISSLDERAFFYHLGNYQSRFSNFKNNFFDFLMKSWTNEIESYNLNQTPLIFSVVEEYIVNKKLAKEDIEGLDIVPELAELSIKLSTTTILDRLNKDSQIRFGDIFKTNFDGKKVYFLCITPQCVCMDSNKVENNFFFIQSVHTTDNLSSSLKKIEIGFVSLVKDENVSMGLDWGDCKPFTLWIKDNDLRNLRSTYSGRDFALEYVTTLKENFAQRISNKSFGYGMSVGIDLPHIIK